MSNSHARSISRRQFAAAAAFTIVPRHVLGGPGRTAPSDRITLATIGLGRQGMAVSMELMPRQDIQLVAVCDCNARARNYVEYGENEMLQSARKLLGAGNEKWGEDLNSPGFAQLTRNFRTSLGFGGREPAKRLVEAYYGSRNPSGASKGCNAYRDFRELLAKEKDLDAVYIATPDHWHAPISIAAMRAGKHVLGQKPMTHSIGEARRVSAMAREKKVAAALPVNNPSVDCTTQIAKWIDDGAIGRVREVHNWSNRPLWPQGIERPAEAQTPPEGLDWDMWLGPAPARPFHNAYLPFVWRGWCDFGCGSFGDMGCYSFAGVFKILGLTPPTVVEASTSESFDETYPKASIVRLEFPAAGNRGPVQMTWYDGGLKPKQPAGLLESERRLFSRLGEGVMYVGDKGIIVGDFNGWNARVYPESARYPFVPAVAPPRDAAIDQWIAACKGGPQPLAAFETQAPVTEAFLLGCIAQRLPGERIEWDTAAMRAKGSEAANKLVDPPYRGNWS